MKLVFAALLGLLLVGCVQPPPAVPAAPARSLAAAAPAALPAPARPKRFTPLDPNPSDEFSEYTVARDMGLLLGAALGCFSITPGDLEYLKAGIIKALAAQEPAADPLIIRDEFNQSARRALRVSSGPTGYDCAKDPAIVRGITRRYGLQLRR